MKFFTLLAVSLIAASSLPISPPCRAGTIEDVDRAKARDALPSFNVLRVASAVVDTETVTINGIVFEVDTTSTAGITSGNTRVNLSGGSTAAAVGTLTSDNTNAAATETVTIGSVVYTFRASPSTTANEVKVGADADASLLNLIRAINLTGTPGTDYGSATVIHPQVSAAASVTSHAFLVTAKIPGAGANSFATTETSAHLSWGASTLASGVSPTATEFTAALTTAINALNSTSLPILARNVSANEVMVTARKYALYACTETLAGSNNAWASATFFGGAQEPTTLRSVAVIQRACSTVEAALQTMHFPLLFTPTAATVQVRTAAGVLVAYDGSVVITGNTVDVNATGSTDPAATDLVTVTASN